MGTIYKCLIVDDETPAHLVLKSHIAQCDDLLFAQSAYNGKEAIQLLSEHEFDIVFLDIDMPLVNGIEVMQTLTKRPVTIVTTAYNHFAFEAFQQDAIDYLLKPISFPRFLKAVEKAKNFYKSQQDKKPLVQSIQVKIDGETSELRLDEIVYFQSIGNYIKIFFKGKVKPALVYDSLKNMLDRIPEEIFIQTHKSYIINSQYIDHIEKENVYLAGDIIIPVGRKYELLLNRVKK
jgi:two-component system, LytTR family, response regulator